jgi:hypothetical protein
MMKLDRLPSATGPLMLTEFTGHINILLARDVPERDARPTEPLMILHTILALTPYDEMYFILYGTYTIFHSLFICREITKLKNAVRKNINQYIQKFLCVSVLIPYFSHTSRPFGLLSSVYRSYPMWYTI